MLLLFLAAPVVAQPPQYLDELESRKDFNRLQGMPLSGKYSQMESVKVVYDVRRDNIYYINSRFFRYHFNFCKVVLGNTEDNTNFNHNNYTLTRGRRYLLGNLSYFRPTGEFLLDFSVGDMITESQIEQLYERIQETTWFGERMSVLLNTSRLQEVLAEHPSLRTALPEDVFANQTYQPIEVMETFGYLRTIVPENVDESGLSPNDIVLLKGPVDNLPPVGGILTTEFQTPLSHLTLLSRNRGIPFAASKNLLANRDLQELVGEMVYYSVMPDTFIIERANPAEASQFYAVKEGKKQIRLKADYSVRSLQEISALGHKSVDVVGGKAANFAELAKVKIPGGERITLPEGAFAIPFYFYWQHIRDCGADSLIALAIQGYRTDFDPEKLKTNLRAIRKRIQIHPLDSGFIQKVEGRIGQNPDFTRMRFRSSTNAEDIAGFNGAGLYTSKTGILGDPVKSPELAIKRVWASLWRFNAYMEREYFNMDQASTAMGLLVHRSFPDESANGVAITKNLYRKDFFGFVINVQKGEESVVDPDPGVTCDQILCYSEKQIGFYDSKNIVEYITRSSLTDGESVLSDQEVVELTHQLSAIKEHFYNKVFLQTQSYSEFGMDVEFKIDGPNRTLYIKQARRFE